MRTIMMLIFILATKCYDRSKAVEYARTYVDQPNSQCPQDNKFSYDNCSPYNYFGNPNICNYAETKASDCANFVSQCLIAGGLEPMYSQQEMDEIKETKSETITFSCGCETNAYKLGTALTKKYGWKRTCGKIEKPPENIRAGDVIIYHKSSCYYESNSHACLIISGGDDPQIACHSNPQIDKSYTIQKDYYSYYDWFHYLDDDGCDLDDNFDGLKPETCFARKVLDDELKTTYDLCMAIFDSEKECKYDIKDFKCCYEEDEYPGLELSKIYKGCTPHSKDSDFNGENYINRIRCPDESTETSTKKKNTSSKLVNNLTLIFISLIFLL